MSAIDSLTHAHVANFFRLPVYWVFEESSLSHLTDSNSDNDQVINQYYLSIGGGSGEHPALIINNDAALFRFLSNVGEIDEPDMNSCEEHQFDYKMAKLAEEIKSKYFDEKNGFKNINEEICHWTIDQNQWPLETFIRLDKEFKEASESEEYLSDKIIEAVALFIINEMPLEHCIKDPQLIEFANMVKSNRWSRVFEDNEIYQKFVGFTGLLKCQTSGKIIRDNKVVWGYSLNDWKQDNLK